jgi:hypothetical protein
VGEAVPLTASVAVKFQRVLYRSSNLDVVFVHRDADSRDHLPRYTEIENGAAEAGWSGPFVCVVPVQMTEAWLLTSEEEIRIVAGRERGRATLGLPSLGEIERTSDPKSRLKDAYMAATETTGRRRKTAASSFGQRRVALLERLDISGKVAQLDSFARLRDDVQVLVADLAARVSPDPVDPSASAQPQ